MTPTPAEDVVAALAEARAEIARLREALEPFAKAWDIAVKDCATRTLGTLGAVAAYNVFGSHFMSAAAALRDAREGR